MPVPGNNVPTNAVDIYDASTNSWSTAGRRRRRAELAAAASGTRVYFGGGSTGHYPYYSSAVDIYDTLTGSWLTASLSQARDSLAATSLGSKVFFAGGENLSGASSVVDIYDTSTGSWSTANLSLGGMGWRRRRRATRSFLPVDNQRIIPMSAPSTSTPCENYTSISSTKNFTLVRQHDGKRTDAVERGRQPELRRIQSGRRLDERPGADQYQRRIAIRRERTTRPPATRRDQRQWIARQNRQRHADPWRLQHLHRHHNDQPRRSSRSTARCSAR